MELKNIKNTERRDSRGRKLKSGESQRKDGMYQYRYTDLIKNRHTVYSWRLTESDRAPKGKKEDVSLREKEKEINKMLLDGTNGYGSRITLNDMFQSYIKRKRHKGRPLTVSTVDNYIRMWNRNIRDTPLGNKKIGEIKKTDIVVVFSDMRESGLSYGTVEFFSKLLSSVFNMAIDDDIILKNPVKRAIDEIEGTHKYRDALSIEQQKSLLEFAKSTNSSMYNKVYILLNTMCRISELAGLTWQDVDMKNKYITISHQLKREKVDGKYKFVIRPTKNKKERCIPMTDEIYSVFYNMRKYYFINRKDYEVDGKKDFIFLSQKGYLLTSSSFLAELKSLVRQYNISAEHPINEICTHTLRHTGCTRNAEQGMDIKVLQYLMGHSNSNITNNVYNHVNAERARKEILALGRENMA